MISPRTTVRIGSRSRRTRRRIDERDRIAERDQIDPEPARGVRRRRSPTGARGPGGCARSCSTETPCRCRRRSSTCPGVDELAVLAQHVHVRQRQAERRRTTAAGAAAARRGAEAGRRGGRRGSRPARLRERARSGAACASSQSSGQFAVVVSIFLQRGQHLFDRHARPVAREVACRRRSFASASYRCRAFRPDDRSRAAGCARTSRRRR